MRARWEGLHAALVHYVTTFEADRQFKQARETEAVLARSESPANLEALLAELRKQGTPPAPPTAQHQPDDDPK